MKIIALETDVAGTSPEQFQPHLRAEARRVWELYLSGVVRDMHFRADRHSAVLVLECESAEAALAHLKTLPLVQAGLITFEVIPLAPYPGFARLFADS